MKKYTNGILNIMELTQEEDIMDMEDQIGDAHIITVIKHGTIKFIHCTHEKYVNSILNEGLHRSTKKETSGGYLGNVIYAFNAEDKSALENAEIIAFTQLCNGDIAFVYGTYTGEYTEVLEGVNNLEGCVTFDCDSVKVQGVCTTIQEYILLQQQTVTPINF